MIAVLSSDVSDELLAKIRGLLEARGWTSEPSRGEEQAVLVVSGPEHPDELQELLKPHAEADVIPILSGREYRRTRTRLRVTAGLVLGFSLVFLFGLMLPLFSFLVPPAETLATPSLVRAALAARIPENSARLVHFNGLPVLLVHSEDERFFAVSAECTHLDDCLLEWSSSQHRIVCPCHGCAFDVYGNVVEPPPSRPLASYEVERIGEDIYVRRER